MRFKIDSMKIPRTLALSLIKKAQDLSATQIGIVIQIDSHQFQCSILNVDVEKLTPEAGADLIKAQLNEYHSQKGELISFFCLQPVSDRLLNSLWILRQIAPTILTISMNIKGVFEISALTLEANEWRKTPIQVGSGSE